MLGGLSVTQCFQPPTREDEREGVQLDFVEMLLCDQWVARVGRGDLPIAHHLSQPLAQQMFALEEVCGTTMTTILSIIIPKY